MVLLFSVGCTTKYPYRVNPQLCTYSKVGDCNSSFQQISKQNDYYLGIIEIDDQGLLRSRRQLNTILNSLKNRGQNQDIVIFIHGWHHNAKEGDTNLRDFRKLLTSISNRKNSKAVSRVYIGWRGESVKMPLLRHITFWDRKSTSIEVGQGAVLELLVRIEDIADSLKNSRLISIGHSFGASVLFSSLKNIFIERFVKSKYKNQIKGFGDIVILLNPAIEAMHYFSLKSLVEDENRKNKNLFKTNQQPILIIATSKVDLATKVAFPIGRVHST